MVGWVFHGMMELFGMRRDLYYFGRVILYHITSKLLGSIISLRELICKKQRGKFTSESIWSKRVYESSFRFFVLCSPI